MRSGVENFCASLSAPFLSSPTYNPAKKPYLKLPRKMQLLYHNLAKGWEWGIFSAPCDQSKSNNGFKLSFLQLQLETTTKNYPSFVRLGFAVARLARVPMGCEHPQGAVTRLRTSTKRTTRGNTPLGYFFGDALVNYSDTPTLACHFLSSGFHFLPANPLCSATGDKNIQI